MELDRQLLLEALQVVTRGLRAGGPVGAVKAAHTWLDGHLNDLAFSPADRGAPACGEGCAHCCRIPVHVTPPEAFAIAEALRWLPAPQRLAISERVDAAERVTRGLSDAEWIARDVACPLLIEERCSVYADRPLGCRSHASPDASWCAAGRGNPKADRVVVASYATAGAHALGALTIVFRRAGARLVLVDLASALQTAITKPRLLKAWLRGARVFGRERSYEDIGTRFTAMFPEDWSTGRGSDA